MYKRQLGECAVSSKGREKSKKKGVTVHVRCCRNKVRSQPVSAVLKRTENPEKGLNFCK